MRTKSIAAARRAWPILRLALLAYLVILLIMLLAETLLVYPAPPAAIGNWNPPGLNHEDVWYQSADGTKLHGWFVPHPQPKRAILYCHGNGEHIAMNAELAAHLRDCLSASVFMFDYRGYGRSQGRPNEEGCIADGRAAQQWLASRMGIEPRDVVLMGRSLGGGVAVSLACDLGAKALIIENTFPTLVDVAALHMPWLPVRWLMRNRYDSMSRIREYKGPLLQSHGVADSLIPIALGRQLFDAASGRKKWLEYVDLGHNDPCPSEYYDELAAFLDSLEEPSEPAEGIRG